MGIVQNYLEVLPQRDQQPVWAQMEAGLGKDRDCLLGSRLPEPGSWGWRIFMFCCNKKNTAIPVLRGPPKANVCS